MLNTHLGKMAQKVVWGLSYSQQKLGEDLDMTLDVGVLCWGNLISHGLSASVNVKEK